MSSLLELLADETGLSSQDLATIVRTAPRRYKVFYIPKRSGGLREIAQPARELKYIQRVLVSKVLAELPVHIAAMAYRKGRSIRDNALMHAGDTPILKMDFEDFFPSIRSNDWQSYCRRTGILDSLDIELSSRILFRKAPRERVLRLSIGAPSSPALSNALMFEFDESISAEADKRGISYTRYADDLTFSGQRIGMLKDMTGVVSRVVRNTPSPRLKLNASKTTFITLARRRVVTGLTLANGGGTGIGRDSRRLISAKVHHAVQGRLNDVELQELSGELAFIKVAEPSLLTRLSDKYGEDALAMIKKSGAKRTAT